MSTFIFSQTTRRTCSADIWIPWWPVTRIQIPDSQLRVRCFWDHEERNARKSGAYSFAITGKKRQLVWIEWGRGESERPTARGMTACRREKEADFNPLSTQSHFKEGELIIANRKCLHKQLYYTLANFFPARRCYLHRCKKMALPRKPRKRLSDLTSLFFAKSIKQYDLPRYQSPCKNPISTIYLGH